MYIINGKDGSFKEVGRDLRPPSDLLKFEKLRREIAWRIPHQVNVKIELQEPLYTYAGDPYPPNDRIISISLWDFGTKPLTWKTPYQEYLLQDFGTSGYARILKERFEKALEAHRVVEKKKRIPFCEVEGCYRVATVLTRDCAEYVDDGWVHRVPGAKHAYCEEHFLELEREETCPASVSWTKDS